MYFYNVSNEKHVRKNKIIKVKYLVVIVFFLAGCNKEAEWLTLDLQGTWELTSTYWIGPVEYEPGNGNIINFSGSAYSQTIKTPDTTYQFSGTFKIYTGKPCDSAKEQTLIKFDDNDPGRFSLSDGKLTIGITECMLDGGSSTYIKIR